MFETLPEFLPLSFDIYQKMLILQMKERETVRRKGRKKMKRGKVRGGDVMIMGREGEGKGFKFKQGVRASNLISKR